MDRVLARYRASRSSDVRPGRHKGKTGFDTATTHAWDLFQHLLRITMITVQVNGNEMAWVCENRFGTEPDINTAYSIETFAWDGAGNLLIKTYYPMPEHVDPDHDPYAHILEGRQ